jgi:hypothetical protein
MAEVVAALISSGYRSPFPATEQEIREFDATVGEALRQHGTRGLIDLYAKKTAMPTTASTGWGMAGCATGCRPCVMPFAMR